MAKREDITLKLKEYFESKPEYAPLAPHIKGGMRIVNYAFKALEAAQSVKCPRGVTIGEIKIRAKDETNTKAVNEVAVACWIIECVEEQLNKESNNEIQKV